MYQPDVQRLGLTVVPPITNDEAQDDGWWEATTADFDAVIGKPYDTEELGVVIKSMYSALLFEVVGLVERNPGRFTKVTGVTLAVIGDKARMFAYMR